MSEAAESQENSLSPHFDLLYNQAIIDAKARVKELKKIVGIVQEPEITEVDEAPVKPSRSPRFQPPKVYSPDRLAFAEEQLQRLLDLKNLTYNPRTEEFFGKIGEDTISVSVKHESVRLEKEREGGRKTVNYFKERVVTAHINEVQQSSENAKDLDRKYGDLFRHINNIAKARSVRR